MEIEEKMSGDYMVRATAGDARVRAFAITTLDTVEEARRLHALSPIVTAALGRLMSGALMMADMLKSEADRLTIQVEGDGPLRGMTVTADQAGHVKGYPKNPLVLLPPNEAGHLNVGGAVGRGSLTVVKDTGSLNPYVGQVELYSGEIAEDLTYYFAQSEQTPTSVGLGVLVSPDNTVKKAGGFLIQLMPGAEEELVDLLEGNLKSLAPVTQILRDGMTPEDMLDQALRGLDVKKNGTKPVSFFCGCSRERMERALVLLGKEELSCMIEDAEPVELRCKFCNRAYRFSVAELIGLRTRASSGKPGNRRAEKSS